MKGGKAIKKGRGEFRRALCALILRMNFFFVLLFACRDVVIDQDAPKEEKIKSFMRQIRNPYCFKVGNVVVKTTFADTDATLDDRLEHYLRNK